MNQIIQKKNQKYLSKFNFKYFNINIVKLRLDNKYNQNIIRGTVVV